MHDVSAYDLAIASASRPSDGAAVARTSLGDIECCRNHPGHEGLPPPHEEELPDGHVLDGRFVIREPVGRSGMATVYRAEDRADGGRIVAVKIPLTRVVSDPVLFGRLQREERIGSGLDHPCLLKYLPVEGASSPYVAMEYLDGCTLAYILHLTRPLPERDALRIASVACEGLSFLHGRGYIHRDLKPSNIMICRDATLRIMDFGLVEEIDERKGLLGGMAGIFGTPEYMAPEQVRNARNDVRTDLYSMGVILYQMLTGVLPFHDEDPWTAAQMRVTGDPEAPRALNPALTPEVEEIVLHAMRRKPSERPASAAALMADLDSPERVQVTGLSGRLQAPRFRLSLHGTPILVGLMIGVGTLLFLGAVFFYVSHPHVRHPH